MYYKTLIFLLFIVSGAAQTDSLLQKGLSVSYSTGVIPATGSLFSLFQSEAIIKGKKWVTVPSFSIKELHGLAGFQGGINLYRKWKLGYGHVSVSYSPNKIFPDLIMNLNGYKNIAKSLELQLGVHSVFFPGQQLYSISTGLAYYRKKAMVSYRIQYYLEESFSQRIIIRRFLRSTEDFLQLAYYHGLQDDILQSQNNQLNNHTLQGDLHLKIYNKTQLQLSLATLAVYMVDKKEQYFTYRIALKRDI